MDTEELKHTLERIKCIDLPGDSNYTIVEDIRDRVRKINEFMCTHGFMSDPVECTLCKRDLEIKIGFLQRALIEYNSSIVTANVHNHEIHQWIQAVQQQAKSFVNYKDWTIEVIDDIYVTLNGLLEFPIGHIAGLGAFNTWTVNEWALIYALENPNTSLNDSIVSAILEELNDSVDSIKLTYDKVAYAPYDNSKWEKRFKRITALLHDTTYKREYIYHYIII